MEIQIQTAKSGDWKIIQRLNNQVFLADKDNDDDLDLFWPFSKTGIAYYKNLANGSYGKCFIAFYGDIPVGYIALALKYFGYRKSKYVEVENIGVEPEFRSKGIGRNLMETAEKWAKQQKSTKLYVSAFWNNAMAIKFYKKCGFYESGLELDKKLQKS